MGWCSNCSKMAGTLWVLERLTILYEQLTIRFLSWYQIIKIAKSDFVNSLSFLRNLVLRSILNVSVICWFFLDSNCSLNLGDFFCWCSLNLGEFLWMYPESGWVYSRVEWILGVGTFEYKGFCQLCNPSRFISCDFLFAVVHFAHCVWLCLIACFAFFVSLACFLN